MAAGFSWTGRVRLCYRGREPGERGSAMKRWIIAAVVGLLALSVRVEVVPADDKEEAPDLSLRHAKVRTVDEKFSVAEALAIRGDRVVAVGGDEEVLKRKGPNTKLMDMQGRNILPGLYDSHL